MISNCGQLPYDHAERLVSLLTSGTILAIEKDGFVYYVPSEKVLVGAALAEHIKRLRLSAEIESARYN